MYAMIYDQEKSLTWGNFTFVCSTCVWFSLLSLRSQWHNNGILLLDFQLSFEIFQKYGGSPKTRKMNEYYIPLKSLTSKTDTTSQGSLAAIYCWQQYCLVCYLLLTAMLHWLLSTADSNVSLPAIYCWYQCIPGCYLLLTAMCHWLLSTADSNVTLAAIYCW